MEIATLFGLQGKHTLVTGDGKVPEEIARLFTEAGAVVSHVRRPVLTEAGVAALFETLGDLDVLVNGSVVAGPWSLETLAMDEWDRVHETNVRGAYLLMREAVKIFHKNSRGGRLINISTIGSVHPVLHGNFAYGSSRAGTNALSRQFAMDFAGDGITSNTILVGAVPSDPFPQACPMPPTGPGVRSERLPMGLGTPADVAPTALLLASAAGRYINGQAIAIDGGFLVA